MSGIDQMARVALAGVLDSLWVALALALAAWALARFLPRTNAATRHLLWWAVLALVVLLPFRGFERGPADRAPNRQPVSIPIARFVPASIAIAPAAFVPARPLARAIFPLRIPAGGWLRLAVILWMLFCLVHLCRIAWSFLYLRGIKRRSQAAPEALCGSFQSWVTACGIRRPVRLLVSGQIASPMAVGFRHPAVILPAALLTQFRDRELDHVLLHELAHVARRDDWTNLGARCLAALVGLHPVAAWVLSQVAHERELACDDWVVSMTGEARPYAASLARLFELCGTRRRMLLAAGMAGSASHLGERIETLLRRDRQFTPHASLMRAALTAMVLLALVVAGVRAPRWIVLAQSPAAPVAALPRPALPVNPHGSFLAALVATGYGNLPVEEIIALKDHGVTADFLAGISQSGWERMTSGELMDLHAHGVSPEYLYQVRTAGFQHPAVRDVIELRAHGVRPEAIGEIHSLGFGPYTPGQAIDLSTHGVIPSFFQALRDAGFARLEPNEAIDAYARGVRPATLRAAGQYGPHLTLPQIVKLKQAGVLA